MNTFYVESVFGAGIRVAPSLEKAQDAFRREVGDYGYKSVRPAKPEDISWVEAMGGYVPDDAKVKK